VLLIVLRPPAILIFCSDDNFIYSIFSFTLFLGAVICLLVIESPNASILLNNSFFPDKEYFD
jgi:hypothetical protein